MRLISSLLLVISLVLSPLAAFAQSGPVTGQVIKVDQSAKKITIKHGPIPKLDMAQGMTMVYAAPDPKMLSTVKAGDKVKFEIEQVNGQYTLTKIERSK